MTLHHLQPRGSRPFSDWLADVQRIVEHKVGGRFIPCQHVTQMLRSYHACGVSPGEAASDLIDD